MDETKITGENKQRIMVRRRQVKNVNKKKTTAAKEPLSRKSKGPKQQSNFQIEHQRQVEIEMERIKETYPVLFPEKEPSEQNHHKTKANGGKRYNSLVNNDDDSTDSVLNPNHKDSSTTMDTEDNQDGGGQPRRKVIESSDESSIEMELDGDSVNNCKAELVKITNVVDLVSDKEESNPPKSPTVTTSEKQTELKSVDSEATNPTNNKDGTKAPVNSRAKKQLKMTKEKVMRATKQTTLTNEIKRNNKIIYSLKLRCPKTKDPMKTMQDKLREWFK